MSMDVCITFDVDMTRHVDGNEVSKEDELERCFDTVQAGLEKAGLTKTTWFLRIDANMGQLYGDSLYVFRRHDEKISQLVASGHEIGWHHHAYIHRYGHWLQDTDAKRVVNALLRYGAQAKALGMSTARMGWGFHTNETIAALDALGFKIDSSAIPRPRYRWEQTEKDWSITPQAPYRPSVSDYRRPGYPSLNLLEVPITTTYLPAPGDKEQVIRYLNPAYRKERFECAVRRVHNNPLLVTVTHPYEVCANGKTHPLLAFDANDFCANLRLLAENGAVFKTMSELL